MTRAYLSSFDGCYSPVPRTPGGGSPGRRAALAVAALVLGGAQPSETERQMPAVTSHEFSRT